MSGWPGASRDQATHFAGEAPLCRYVPLTSYPVSAEGILAVLAFGLAESAHQIEIPTIAVPLPLLCQQRYLEVWTGPEPISRGKLDGVEFAHSTDVLFGWVSFAELATDLKEATRETYKRFIAAARKIGFPHILRTWNYVPRINSADPDGLERYRNFCIGRHAALAESYSKFESHLPGATAVGSEADHALVYFLAGRTPGLQIENPRQVSAFRYPAEHGPRSPSFSRAVLKDWRNETTLYISGTASITGHESRHDGDIKAQVREIWQNIDALLRVASRSSRPLKPSLMKVYLRHPEHYGQVREMVLQKFPEVPTLSFKAEICRSNLLVEIEAIATPIG